MKLSEITAPQYILANSFTGTQEKWQLIRALVKFALGIYNQNALKSKDESYRPVSVEEMEMAESLVLERETSMTTGIGEYVAIPHASLPFLQKPLAVLAIFKDGIDFQAMDSQAVKVVILLLVPKDQFQSHIQTLANIARLAHQSDFLEKICDIQDSEEVYQTILTSEKTLSM